MGVNPVYNHTVSVLSVLSSAKVTSSFFALPTASFALLAAWSASG